MAVADQFETVQKLYIAFYQRPADFAGRDFWAEQVETQGLQSVINAFATSAEATALYGEINNDTIGDVIEAIYQAAFGRPADGAGKAWYVAEFEAGNFTAATIALNVVNGAVEADATVLSNKVQAADLFTAAVEGVEYNEADITAARDFLAGVTDTVPTQAEVDAVVEQVADDGVTTPVEGLVTALGTLAAAQDARADFLEGLELDTNIDGTIDVEAGDAVAGDVGTYFNNAAGLLANSSFTALDAAAYQSSRTALQDADIQAAIAGATEAVETAADAAENGMQALLEQVDVRSDALVSALEAENDAEEAVTEAQAIFGAVAPTKAGYSVAVTASAITITNDGGTAGDTTDDSVTNIATKGLNGTWSLNTTAADVTAILAGLTTTATTLSGVKGLNDLVSAVQAESNAAAATATATTALSNAVNDVILLENDAFSVTTNNSVIVVTDTAGSEAVAVNFAGAATVKLTEGASDTALTAAAPDAAELATAIGKLESLNDAVATYQEARELAGELKALTDAVTAAEQAIENDVDAAQPGLGYNLLDMGASVTATTDDDLILFNDAPGTTVSISGFGQRGLDQIYFGEEYTLTALGENDITKNVGDSSVLEVFWKQTATGLDLYVESAPFAGNGSTSADVTMVTLTGVTSEQVALENGFLFAGEVA